ncbi:MAG: hypothetical protein EF813_09680 [Methanosarcinales archaeon]|nr:MAG: hypothetical protein EF813_09680 [Methanosarcinales archaeon]
MDEVEHAVSCFKDGFSCSQAVLSAYSERFGLDHEMALKVSGAFGGGMRHLGETCGAVTVSGAQGAAQASLFRAGIARPRLSERAKCFYSTPSSNTCCLCEVIHKNGRKHRGLDVCPDRGVSINTDVNGVANIEQNNNCEPPGSSNWAMADPLWVLA